MSATTTPPDLFHAILASGSLTWRRWGAAALDEARTRDLPVLVFAGAALDHWSAAMAAELVADHEAGTLIDELFVPVAIEVAGEPALAARVQQALALTADASGWPACAFLTPAGQPFGACAFRPLRDRERQVGLVRILLDVAAAWRERRADVQADAARVAAACRRMAEVTRSDQPLNPDLVLDNAEAQAMAIADTLEGGFGPPPRHPSPTLLRFLIARCRRPDAPLALARQVERSLAALVAGACHDQLAGGFHRACADAAWREPFFEKRLADQAQLALALFDAADAFGQRLYRDVAERTLRWCVAALRREDGTYARGLHADSRGADGVIAPGAAATWTLDEFEAVLGAEGAALVARRFGLGDTGHWALAVREPLADAEASRLPALLQRLAVARAEREIPLRDERLDAGAHGALLAALARARRQTKPDRELVAAGRALFRTMRRWARVAPFAIEGVQAVARSTGDLAWVAIGVDAWRGGRPGWTRNWAQDWLQQQYAHCCVAHDPGRFLIQAGAHALVLDPAAIAIEDSAEGPSGSAVLALAAVQLGRSDQAAAVIKAYAGLLRRTPLAGSGLCLALDQMLRDG